MSCELNQYKNYGVESVSRDVTAGKYVVKLTETSAKCPEGLFVSSRLIIRKGADTNSLAYSAKAHTPILSLRRGTTIVQISDPISAPVQSEGGLGFFGWSFIVLLAAAGIYAVKKLFEQEEKPTSHTPPQDTLYRNSYHRSVAPGSVAPRVQPTIVHDHSTVIVQQGSSVDPLTAGLVGYELGQMGNNNFRDDSVARELRENRLYEEQRDLDRDRRDLENERTQDRMSQGSGDSDSTFSDDSSSTSDDSSSSDTSSFSDDSGSSFSDDSSSGSFSDDT